MQCHATVALIGQMVDGLADQNVGQSFQGLAMIQTSLTVMQGPRFVVCIALDAQSNVRCIGIPLRHVPIQKTQNVLYLRIRILDGDTAAYEIDQVGRHGLRRLLELDCPVIGKRF